MTIAWNYLVNCHIYLYKTCDKHVFCFELKHNDDNFLKELKFMGAFINFCQTDMLEALRNNVK